METQKNYSATQKQLKSQSSRPVGLEQHNDPQGAGRPKPGPWSTTRPGIPSCCPGRRTKVSDQCWDYGCTTVLPEKAPGCGDSLQPTQELELSIIRVTLVLTPGPLERVETIGMSTTKKLYT